MLAGGVTLRVPITINLLIIETGKVVSHTSIRELGHYSAWLILAGTTTAGVLLLASYMLGLNNIIIGSSKETNVFFGCRKVCTRCPTQIVFIPILVVPISREGINPTSNKLLAPRL